MLAAGWNYVVLGVLWEWWKFHVHGCIEESSEDGKYRDSSED
jgi:hypothetical protein